MAENSEGVAAVDRALAILSVFSEEQPTLSLAELARKTGLYKSTILRLLTSLEAGGLIRRLYNGRYQLGPQLLHLGTLYQNSFQLNNYLQPILEELAIQTGESTAFYIRDNESKVCLYRTNSTQHTILRYIQPGYRTDLNTGASGQILLAFTESEQSNFQSIRDILVVASLSQREEGTAAISCPVFGLNQTFQGALTVSGPLSRFQENNIQILTPKLLKSAIKATKMLGGDANGLNQALSKYGS